MTTALETARSLRDTIEAESERVEAEATMTPPVVEAIVESGLFRLLVPKALGGHEADVRTIIDVSEELSYADGSVGWAYCQNVTVMSYAAYLAPEFAEPLARARAAAGMFAPLGVAQPEDGGFRLSGRYGFGSGSGHAEFMGGSVIVNRPPDAPPPDPAAGPLAGVLAFIVPTERVKIDRHWDVLGLCGTGSFDFEVPEQFVEAGRTFPIFAAEPVEGGAIYRIGPLSLGTLNSAAWAVGVANRALHEIEAIAKGGRMRLGSQPLIEQPIFQRDLGLHRTAVRAGRAHLVEAYEAAVDAYRREAPPEECAARMGDSRAAASYATRISKQAATFAFEASGSAGIRNPSRLQRCFRDLCVGAGHQVFDERNFIDLAKRHLGFETAGF